MRLKEKWWRFNYQLLRAVVVPVAKRILRVQTHVVGELPVTRPVFLAPVHRTSVDVYAVGVAVGEFVSFVSTDSFGHSRCVNWAQKQLTRSLGSVIWHQRGLVRARHRAVLLARDVDDRLNRRLNVAAFAQGEYQPYSVNTLEEGLLGLLARYERHHPSEKGHDLRIPIVPVGIRYDYNGQGLRFSRTFQWLADHVPRFPGWSIPAVKSKIIVAFGEPHYLNGRNPTELTEIVMREAAEFSGIPYEVEVMPVRKPGA